ncbi:MAG: NAD-dependent epimerase/dehydratase family protein, partial [Sciscionella sp.]
VRHWTCVSTCSVYADDATPGQDESGPLLAPWTGTGAAPTEEYGPAKVACEEAVRETRAAAAYAVTRPGLIVGEGDPSDRFGYWPGRVARAVLDHEPMLVPPRDTPVQVIDVVDYAAWLVTLAEDGASSTGQATYNAVGDSVNVDAVLDASASLVGAAPEAVEVADDWLEEQGVEPWAGPDSLPLWLPPSGYAGFMLRRNDAAKAAGLTIRPLADSVEAALSWERARGLGRDRRAGLSPAREAELLARTGS